LAIVRYTFCTLIFVQSVIFFALQDDVKVKVEKIIVRGDPEYANLTYELKYIANVSYVTIKMNMNLGSRSNYIVCTQNIFLSFLIRSLNYYIFKDTRKTHATHW
jgi:hypothetical protein